MFSTALPTPSFLRSVAARASPATPFSPLATPLPAMTVGGLARGVDPEELAALIARALPSGASPTAEIMRDASTGIERGFGYVSVPAGEGVKAGAERAIAAYHGTRFVLVCAHEFQRCYRTHESLVAVGANRHRLSDLHFRKTRWC